MREIVRFIILSVIEPFVNKIAATQNLLKSGFGNIFLLKDSEKNRFYVSL